MTTVIETDSRGPVVLPGHANQRFIEGGMVFRLAVTGHPRTRSSGRWTQGPLGWKRSSRIP